MSNTTLTAQDVMTATSTVPQATLDSIFSTYTNGTITLPTTTTMAGLSGQYIYFSTPGIANTTTSIPYPTTLEFSPSLSDKLVAAIQTYGLKHKRDCPFEKCNCGVHEVEQLIAASLDKTP